MLELAWNRRRCPRRALNPRTAYAGTGLRRWLPTLLKIMFRDLLENGHHRNAARGVPGANGLASPQYRPGVDTPGRNSMYGGVQWLSI
jgi:hypothetical protein